MERCIPSNFVSTVYGNLTPLNNSALSKARLKIFYKGLNRNGSYIDDAQAERLLSTLPGTPVVGYFDADMGDFLGHEAPEKSKPYGFVPEDMNFAWETNLDPDGVYRTYACVDLILWTGRYPVASTIVGKSHSMELNPETVQGEWVDDEDEGFYFKFTNAEFFGLCVLGDEVEPCFEGSCFYDLHRQESCANELKELYSLYEQVKNDSDDNLKGGQNSMENETIETVADEVVEEVSTEEVITEEVAEPAEEVEVEAEEVETETEAEVATEHELAEEDKEEANEEEENADATEVEVEEEIEEEASEEVEEDVEEVVEEKIDYAKIIEDKDAEIMSLKEQLATLENYRNEKIKEEKISIIEKFASKLTEEEVAKFNEEIDNYANALELKKEIGLCILAKVEESEEEPTIEYSFVGGKADKEYNGVDAIIAKYVK